MPGCHLDTQSRFCGAATIVSHQNNVYVNNLLWAVEGDRDTHCNAGALQAVYGSKNVYINNIKVICAVGDSAAPDFPGCKKLHPTGATNPKGHSSDTNVYR